MLSSTSVTDKVAPHLTHRLPHGVPAALARGAARARTDDRVELTLDPVELGKVRFDFTTTNDRITINLSVERPETLDLLRRHADTLRSEFREAGFDGSSLSFSQWSQQGQDKSTAARLFAIPEGEDFAPAAPDPTPTRTNTATGLGLDLRL